VKRIWGAGIGWLDGKSRLEDFRLKVDNLSSEQMCAGSKFQVDGAETENAREVKLLVMLKIFQVNTQISVRWHGILPV